MRNWLVKQFDEGTFVVLLLFCLPFLCAGCLAYWQSVVNPMKAAIASSGWQSVPCVIVVSRIDTVREDCDDYFKANVHFKYEVDGKRYFSNRVDFSSETRSLYRESMDEFCRKFPLRSEQTCYVNMENPSEAILLRGWVRNPFDWGTAVMGIVLTLGGAAAMSLGVVSFVSMIVKHPVVPGRGVKLDPAKKRWTLLVAALIFFVVCSGVIVCVARLWVACWSLEHANGTAWILWCFLIPLGLIGSGAFGLLLSSVRYLSAPWISLHVNPGLDWYAGERVDIQWSLINHSIPESLTIALVCQETASYNHGTSIFTERLVVAELLMMSHSGMKSKGGFSFDVSKCWMPSFKSNHNTVEWSVRVGVSGPGSDADDVYKVNLLPKRTMEDE